ncbi:hypothetical protein BGZ63DRAFT_271453 [Mariannaea sp. PMI_226]|nr:hypothetical protein BGZ63DRAFT_271453 [Mariannaea sp. PMI_226]
MPQTGASLSNTLGIQLEGIKAQYAPGDVLVGYVYRKQHLVSPGASVTVSLHGRTKSKMVVSRGNSTSTYRGRFNVLSGPRNTIKVFDGPIHIPAGSEGQAWPFSLQIPTHVDNMHLADSVSSATYSYLPLTPQRTARHELPDSFAVYNHGFTTIMEGFVEYVLHAQLRVTKQGSIDTIEASLPLTLRAVSSEPPIIDFRLRRMEQSYSIISYRLVPGAEQTELTFSQKTRQLFNSSKVPTLNFNYRLETPTVIQLDNPNHVPIVIRAAPNWSKTTDIIHGIPYTATLKSLSLFITTTTSVRCEGVFGPHDAHTDQKLDLQINSAIQALTEPIVIPITDDMTPIDIGALINLRIDSHGRVGATNRQKILQPSFTTYNIQHTHQLKWVLSADIAGSVFKASGYHQVTLVKPSDDKVVGIPLTVQLSSHSQHEVSWIKPPEDEVAPPSFTQVQKEDAKRAAAENGDSKKG